jgi:type II secretory ATPase GspE/PulE/Tfp pilus assembly ATPase PilB-like protein
MSFLEELVKRKIINGSQILDIKNLAQEKYSGDIEEALIQSGINEDDILKAKGEYYNMPTRRVDIKALSFSILKYIPEDSAKYYHFVPFALEEGVLLVGVTDPEDIQGMDALQFISAKLGLPFKIFLIPKSDYDEVMNSYKGMSVEVEQALGQFGDDDEEKDLKDLSKDLNETDLSKELSDVKMKDGKMVEDAPIIKIVAVILRNAIEGNASDIHIEHIGEKVKVRYRRR